MGEEMNCWSRVEEISPISITVLQKEGGKSKAVCLFGKVMLGCHWLGAWYTLPKA